MTSRTKNREPRSIPLDRIEFDPEPQNEALELPTYEPPLGTRRFRWAGLFFAALAALLALAAGRAVTRLVDALFLRSAALGWIGAACLAVAGLAALAVVSG